MNIGDFKKGDRVKHPNCGYGVVDKIDAEGVHVTYDTPSKRGKPWVGRYDMNWFEHVDTLVIVQGKGPDVDHHYTLLTTDGGYVYIKVEQENGAHTINGRDVIDLFDNAMLTNTPVALSLGEGPEPLRAALRVVARSRSTVDENAV